MDVGVVVGALVLLNRTDVAFDARKVVALAYGGRVVLNRGVPVELRNGVRVALNRGVPVELRKGAGFVALVEGSNVLLEKGVTVEFRNGAEVVTLARANGGLVALKDGMPVEIARVPGVVEFTKCGRVVLAIGKLVVFKRGAGAVAFRNGADVELDFAAVLVAWEPDTLVDDFEKNAVLEAPRTVAGFVVFEKWWLPARLTDVRDIVVFDLTAVLLPKSGADAAVVFGDGALLVMLVAVLEPVSGGI